MIKPYYQDKSATISGLHCGACMKDFKYLDSLSKHLETCVAAKTLLPFILQLYFLGEARPGHHLSHFIQSLHNNMHLFDRYATAITNETPSMERAKIHALLCKSLGLDYADFRPFEAENITKVPTIKEAKSILWEAFREEMGQLLKQQER